MLAVITIMFVGSLRADPPQLGPLQVATVVVNNLDSAMEQWSAGTGTQFNPVESEDVFVKTSQSGWHLIRLKSALSVRNGPFLELVQATPAIGPWAHQKNIGSTPGYQVYVVNNIDQAGSRLVSAGMKKIARACNFSIYQGANGILIKLMKSGSLPAGKINVPQAAIDLGGISHTDIAIQNLPSTRDQLAQALNINWTEFDSNNVPFDFTDGVHLVNTSVLASTSKPVIELELVTPPLGVWATTTSSYNFHVAYTVPAGSVSAVDLQMKAANYTLNTYINFPGIGMILTYYTNSDNIWIEVVDVRFDL